MASTGVDKNNHDRCSDGEYYVDYPSLSLGYGVEVISKEKQGIRMGGKKENRSDFNGTYWRVCARARLNNKCVRACC